MRPRRGPRITIRQVMLASCIVALGMACSRLLLGVWSAVNDTYYTSSKELVGFWVVGDSPDIVVDTFAGRIDVIGATDSAFTARVRPFAGTKESQTAADAALEGITIDMAQDDGRITVIARRALETACVPCQR